MKNSVLLSLFVLTGLFAIGQKENPLEVVQYRLENGLTVMLNVDKSQPNVFGMVVVKGGSKRDPNDATGIAHYFEHIMFKGSEKLGSIDYATEKIYLDSIAVKYDELALASTDEDKEKIQLEINRISMKAGEYAIPNEFDKVIAKIGGTNLNAFTSNDLIAYHNSFPANQMEKWMAIYSDRFIDPVFRLFQSELETVYEEKNMSMDNSFNKLFEVINEGLYKGHPYENTVLGSIAHLKNPSLRKMQEYFDTYYVANNMALILVGNFDVATVKPMIEKYFGIWRQGEIPSMPEYTPKPFDGREFISKKLTPIRVGLMAFRTTGRGSNDDVALQILNKVLSNEASTGYLDKLYHDNKLMMSGCMELQYADLGANMVLFVPKIVGQSFKKVEKLVYAEVSRLGKGDFDDEMIAAIKINLKKDFYQSLESPNYRGYFMMDAFMQGKDWKQILLFPEEVDRISREELIRVARQYYGENYLTIYSKMGFPKKEKLKKPNFKHLEPKNSESKSDFAKQIEQMPVVMTDPVFIEFGKDVEIQDVTDKIHFYFTPNPINNIFSISLEFGLGTIKNPELDPASTFFNLLGTEKRDFPALKKEFQKLGASVQAYADRDAFVIYIDGLEENMEATLTLVHELLAEMKADDKQLEKLVSESKVDRKFEDKEPYSIGEALDNFAMYGDNSPYLTRPTIKEIKARTAAEWVSMIKEAMKYEVDIHYSGKTNSTEIRQKIVSNLVVNSTLEKTESPVEMPRIARTERTVFLLEDKKLIQSQITFFMEGTVLKPEEMAHCNSFNEYFGGGMYSLVFQEAREFRSLAYSAWAYFRNPPVFGRKSYLLGGITCQADKTIEAIQIFDSLITKMPRKPERLEIIRESLLQAVNSYRPSFRYLSQTVARWRMLGYKEDPRKQYLEVYNKLKFSDIVEFYKNHLNRSPLITTVAGDTERFDVKALAPFGKTVVVTKKEIFN